MTLITVVSAKHAPGATTSALVLAAAADPLTAPIVLEGDPAGGDLAARAGTLFDPGMATLFEHTRNGGAAEELGLHAHVLPTGVRLVVGSVDPEKVSRYADDAAAVLAPLLQRAGVLAVVDAGRWGSVAGAAWAARSDLVVVAMRPTVDGAEHVVARLPSLRRVARAVRPLAIGDDPLRPADVADILGCPVSFLPSEPATAQAVGEGRIGLDALRVTRLFAAAERVLSEISVTGDVPARTGPGADSDADRHPTGGHPPALSRRLTA